MIEFVMLGEVGAARDGAPIPLGPPKQRQLLVRLLLARDRVVSLDDLIDELWPEDPPKSAVANLRLYAANLRRVLLPAGGGRPDIELIRLPSGYRLSLTGAGIDVDHFATLAATGEDALRDSDFPAAIEAYRAALDRWHGTLAADLPHSAFVAAHARALWEQRLVAVEYLAVAQAAAGNPIAAAATMQELTRAEPLRERGHQALIVYRYAAGDAAAALDAYQVAVEALAEELGIDPGPELQATAQEIRTREPADTLLADHLAQHGLARKAERSDPLPPDTRAFSGRTREMSILDTMSATSTVGSTAVVVGMAGVGKTALAVHWARTARDRFPDGQLYVNLRGFDPVAPPLAPAEALRGFLDALGVPAATVPRDVDALTGLYRSRITGRRMIVLLDNAADAAQVTPLLPAAPECTTVVTSRVHLPGLVTATGAVPVHLDLLDRHDARRLITALLGPDRPAGEPEAVEELVAACAGLPLALTVVAALAAFSPNTPLARLAAELADGGLDTFDTGDPTIDIRAMFDLSYRALSPAAARLFRFVGRHPGPGPDAWAAASALAAPITETRRTLRELLAASLLSETPDGRYTTHDLLRAYALRRWSDQPDEDGWQRVLDHYVHTALAADLAVEPARHRFRPTPARPGVVVPPLPTASAAMAWFAMARPNILAAIDDVAADLTAEGHGERVIDLASSCASLLDRASDWTGLATTHQALLDAAVARKDEDQQATAHYALARAQLRGGGTEPALAHLRTALALLDRIGRPARAAHIYNEMAAVHGMRDDNAAALECVRAAYQRFVDAGDLANTARSLNGIGWFQAQLGHYDEALDRGLEALELLTKVDDDFARAETLDSIGFAQQQLGRFEVATESFGQAYALFIDLGDAYQAALTRDRLGDAVAAGGDREQAAVAWREAALTLERLGHPQATAVRAKLGDNG